MELEFLQKELERVSEWVRFSDRKTAFLSVYYTALMTIFLNNIENIKKINENNLLICILVILIISFVIGIYFLVMSIFPRLKNNSTNKSLFYFSNIAGMKIIDFLENMENLTEQKAKKQIIEQIYTNSEIANQKMNNIKKSIKALIVSIVSLMILILMK